MIRLSPFELDQTRGAVGRSRASHRSNQRIAFRKLIAAGDTETALTSARGAATLLDPTVTHGTPDGHSAPLGAVSGSARTAADGSSAILWP